MRIERYVGFAQDAHAGFRPFMQEAANPDNWPLLFHCQGGKDRTGFAAAMVMLTLGVPREQVMADYLLTNVYTAAQIEAQKAATPQVLHPIFGAYEEQLGAALDYIDAQHGSFDSFRREVLGISDETVERIREAMLE